MIQVVLKGPMLPTRRSVRRHPRGVYELEPVIYPPKILEFCCGVKVPRRYLRWARGIDYWIFSAAQNAAIGTFRPLSRSTGFDTFGVRADVRPER